MVDTIDNLGRLALKTAMQSGLLLKGGFFFIVLAGWYVIAAYLAVASLGIQQFNARDLSVITSEKSIPGLLELADDKEQGEIDARQAKIRYKQIAQKLNGAKIREADISAKLQKLQQKYPNDEIRNKAIEWQDAEKSASALDVEIISWESHRDVAKNELKEAQDGLNTAREKLTDQDLVAIEKIKRWQGQKSTIEDWAPFLFNMPREFLTLILTLSMGIFGSTIHVSRVFISSTAPETENRIWYVFRPMLGAFMAFAVYIFFKSGGLMYSSAGGNGSDTHLNPFVIAFVALISGLFSEHAYVRLDNAAQKLFRPSGNIPSDGEDDDSRGDEQLHASPQDLSAGNKSTAL
jgi:hypothetical protein